MSQATLSRRENLLIRVVAYVTLLAVMVIGVSLAATTQTRWATIVLCPIFGLVMAFMPSSRSPTWAAYLYTTFQTSLTTALMFVHPDWTVFTLLFFILSAQVVLLFTPRLGAAWIGVFILLTAGLGIYHWGWSGGVVALYGGAYAFFGIFANALVRADIARRKSQALLAELQEAHQRLQDYTLRIEELAVVEERNRLAREMHDTLGHRLTVASVQLEGAQRLCSTDAERAASMVETVREQVHEALGELRSTVATLRTPVEADLHLRSSLGRLVADFEEVTGLTVHRVLPDEMPHLPAAQRLALFRAAQEALTNVQKHATARQVWLVLAVRDNSVTLLVSDDGKGISVRSDRAGFGLRGLRERAAQLGGEVYLEPRRGGGTQLSMRIPLPSEEPPGGVEGTVTAHATLGKP